MVPVIWNVHKIKSTESETRFWWPGPMGCNRDWLLMNMKSFLWWWKCPKAGLWGWLHKSKFTKYHLLKKNHILKWVNFTICKLHLNKAVKTKKINCIMVQRFSILEHSLMMKIKETENQVQKCILHCNFYISLLSLCNL